jgi:hypothetical protein
VVLCPTQQPYQLIPGKLPARRGYMVSLFCRNEGVIDTHIYAPNVIITHGLLTLSAITAQPSLSLWREIRSPSICSCFRLSARGFRRSGQPVMVIQVGSAAWVVVPRFSVLGQWPDWRADLFCAQAWVSEARGL